MSKRPAVDYRYLGRKASPSEAAGTFSGRGISGDPHIEGHPKYIKSRNEKIISDRNGCYFTMGRDKPYGRATGYGHEHQSACIQMKVGRCSVDNLKATDSDGNELYVDNNIEKDAATYYMSQKANIDDYFALKPGVVGMSRAKSAIALKADAVRLVGREGIKLVTKGGDIKNSQGGLLEYVRGIDLIAGNDDKDLQPMVKGRNLVEALDVIIQWAGKMNNIVLGNILQQQKIVAALMSHQHHVNINTIDPLVSPLRAYPDIQILLPVCGTVASKLAIDGVVSTMGHRINGEFLKMGYLNRSGRKYILSRHNNTN